MLQTLGLQIVSRLMTGLQHCRPALAPDASCPQAGPISAQCQTLVQTWACDGDKGAQHAPIRHCHAWWYLLARDGISNIWTQVGLDASRVPALRSTSVNILFLSFLVLSFHLGSQFFSSLPDWCLMKPRWGGGGRQQAMAQGSHLLMSAARTADN